MLRIGREVEHRVAIEDESHFHLASSLALVFVDSLHILSTYQYLYQHGQQCHGFLRWKLLASWAFSFATSGIANHEFPKLSTLSSRSGARWCAPRAVNVSQPLDVWGILAVLCINEEEARATRGVSF